MSGNDIVKGIIDESNTTQLAAGQALALVGAAVRMEA